MTQTMKWQPIETAPKDGKIVLLSNKAGDHMAIGFWNGDAWDDGDFLNDMGSFDYWMPLPLAPESKP